LLSQLAILEAFGHLVKRVRRKHLPQFLLHRISQLGVFCPAASGWHISAAGGSPLILAFKNWAEFKQPKIKLTARSAATRKKYKIPLNLLNFFLLPTCGQITDFTLRNFFALALSPSHTLVRLSLDPNQKDLKAISNCASMTLSCGLSTLISPPFLVSN
jgi:hypothetical protein